MNFFSLFDRLLRWRVRQLFHARQDENLHSGQKTLDSDGRFNDRRRISRLDHFLPFSVSGHLANRSRDQGDDQQLLDQGGLGGGDDTDHLQNRCLLEARGRRRLLRL